MRFLSVDSWPLAAQLCWASSAFCRSFNTRWSHPGRRWLCPTQL